MNPDIDSSSILPQTAAQKLEVTVGEQTDHPALLQIHGQFQFPLQELSAGFQHMLSRSPAFGHHYDVIRIPNHLHTTFGHFLVKLVQVNVC